MEREGEEADDVIATLATTAASDGCRVLIATSDKDLAQLVDDRVSLLRPDGKQTALIDADQVKERYGVCPDQIVDYLSMIGDSVDDIPGIPGVGPKTAAALLQQFGTFDVTLDRVALRKCRARNCAPPSSSTPTASNGTVSWWHCGRPLISR